MTAALKIKKGIPIPEPPGPLGQHGKRLWRETLTNYDDWAPHHLAILYRACRWTDTAMALDRRIQRDGLTVRGNKNQLKPHPLLSKLSDASKEVRAAFRELSLDARPADSRPPRIARRYA